MLYILSISLDMETHMSDYTFKQAKRRYHLVYWPTIAVYCAACIGGALLLKAMDTPPEWMAPAIAVFTIAPMFVVLWLIWRYVRETDEYTRMQQLQALAIGGLVCAGATGLIGILQIFEVIGDFPIFLFLPLFFLSYGLAKWLRSGKDCV